MVENQNFWKFVSDNASIAPDKLRLKYHNAHDLDFDVELAITQIECRRKFGKKFCQTLAIHPYWIFPSVLSAEQSTSDALAYYHASLIDEGTSVADLTAGAGIDTLHLSQKAKSVVAVEIEKHKADILKLNTADTNITSINADCRDFVNKYSGDRLDTIFIDPARRAADGSRVFALCECQPDVISMLDSIRKMGKRLIVKMSPMLDITHTALSLPGTTEIIVLGTPSECKELLAVVNCDSTHSDSYRVKCVVHTTQGCREVLSFEPSEEKNASAKFTIPTEDQYIYEPWAAVVKTGAINLLAQKYGLEKLHPNTQVYTSSALVTDFPGTVTKIAECINYASSEIKRFRKKYPLINVAAKNFGTSTDALRTKLKVKDGGELRLLATTVADGSKRLIVCQPI